MFCFIGHQNNTLIIIIKAILGISPVTLYITHASNPVDLDIKIDKL